MIGKESERGITPQDKIRIRIEGESPIVEGIPEGHAVLFFALLSQKKGFCVIYGPPEKCLPKDWPVAELWDAKAAVGNIGDELQVHHVRHGHKYVQGGGMVEFGPDNHIFFRTQSDNKPSTYKEDLLDEPQSVEKVYIAL